MVILVTKCWRTFFKYDEEIGREITHSQQGLSKLFSWTVFTVLLH